MVEIKFTNMSFSPLKFFSGLKNKIFNNSNRILFNRLSNTCDITYELGTRHLVLNKHTRFPHPLGIVIGAHVKIGSNCTIYQNVTLGASQHPDHKINPKNYPRIGNNVTIYPSSVIIGNIEIGDDSIIGANSFVNTDIPNGQIWAGSPAKFVKNI